MLQTDEQTKNAWRTIWKFVKIHEFNQILKIVQLLSSLKWNG